MFGKIRTRLTIAFIGLAVLPILFLGSFIAAKTFTAAKQLAISVTHDTALRVGGDVEDFIRGMVDHIEVVTKTPGLHNLSRQKQLEIMRELLAFQSGYDQMTILDPLGQELVRVNRLQMVNGGEIGNWADQREFLAPLQTREIYYGPVLFRENTGEPYMTCSVPFTDPQTGMIAGIVVGELRLKKIWHLLATLDLRPGEQVYIVNHEGLVIAHKNPSIVLRGTQTHLGAEPDNLQRSHHPDPLGDQAILGDHHIFLGDQRLHIICEWEKRHALSLAYRLMVVIGLGTLIALAAAVLVMVPVVGNIVRPLQRLATTARKIEKGNLTEQAEVAGDDEIGELAHAFNRMTAQLHSSMTDLQTEVMERTDIQKALQRELLINKSLASLSKAMLASEDIKELADEILKRAQQLTASEHGYVGYIDQKSGNLVCPTITAMQGKQCQIEGDDFKMEFPPNADGTYDHLWGVALNSRQPFLANNPMAHPSSQGCPTGHVSLERFLTVPVLFNDQLVGQIAVANSPSDYGERDIDTLERLSDLYALALNRDQGQQEKEKLLSDLRQSQKMEAIGTLAGGIAHDFNNMLTPILGYSELALTRLTPDHELFSHLQTIHQAADRAKELIKQILTFSRQREHELTTLKIQPILRETIKLLRSSLPTTIYIRPNIDPHCGAILSDLTQFQQIVMNLGTNAYHAMGDSGGTLEISLQEIPLSDQDPLVTSHGLHPGPAACLTISDTGCGMDKTTVSKIFDPYFTTKEQGKGTGMGLAMVHGIIRNHHGHISVYSEPGQGTTFKIYLPIVSEERALTESATTGTAAGGTERILLVDDEEVIILMLRDMLEYLGYQVVTITSSSEALKMFEERPDYYDLVITDQPMPELTGGELAKAMLAIRPDIPIILCTGFSESFTEELARDMGIRAYIMKPVILQELTEKIRAVLSHE